MNKVQDKDGDLVSKFSEIKHIGEARAKALVEDLGITSVEQLIEKANANELQQIKGVGPSREDSIREAARDYLEQQTAEASTAPEADEPTETEDEHPPEEPEKADQTPDEKSATPVDRFIDKLRCPACGYLQLERGPATLECSDCGREYNFYNGIADLAPPKPESRNLTQRIMQSRMYIQFYEDVMRPRLTAIVSDRTMREEYELSTELLELNSDSTVLDVGCGTGNFTRHFLQNLRKQDPDSDHLVTGMDLSWSMLEKARTLLTQQDMDRDVYLIRGDATRIPVQRAAYNRLHCAGTLHIVNNIDEALRNFSRVLEPGGICVIGTFLLGDNPIQKVLKKAAEIPSHFHWFTREELHTRLERVGFKVIEDSIAGDAITVKAKRL